MLKQCQHTSLLTSDVARVCKGDDCLELGAVRVRVPTVVHIVISSEGAIVGIQAVVGEQGGALMAA